MKVLVTGAAGFLGSHVCELFAMKGWQVVGYDSLTKYELARTGYNAQKAREHNVNFLKSIGADVILGDVVGEIRNYSALFFAARGCDYIINCAAQPAMTIALEDPMYDADVNIMGTLNILQVARKLNVPVALCSTIHVYGNEMNEFMNPTGRFYWWGANNQGEIDEENELLTGQTTPLHVSKYADELYARAFTESYGLKVFTARLTGIYGERQFGGEDHGWVANFAIKTLLNQPITVFGTDKQVRDILYVKDAAQAFYDWFENGQVSGVYNIGGGVPCITSIKMYLDMLHEITGKNQAVTLAPARKGDLWYFCCDTTKALKFFGWKPTVLPKDGLVRLVDWVKENEEIFKG
jgi:CDP-paratose 2-epimerase